jgi:hypothetical protein
MNMQRPIIGIAVVAVIATGAYAVLAGNHCSKPCATSAQASAGSTCGPAESAASCEGSRGKIAGCFDPAMSGACRFACATKLRYSAGEVLAQPGAKAGRLTQCPVSGVVFAMDASRPRARVGSEEYVTCCDKCATKLKRDPRHYLKS